MVRKLMTAALILTLGLALTACGNETAGTAAAGLAPTPLPRSGPSSGRATPEVPWRTGATGLTTRTRPAVWTATTLTAPTAPGAAPKRT